MNNNELQELLEVFYTGNDQIKQSLVAIMELSKEYQEEAAARKELVKLLNDAKDPTSLDALEMTKLHVAETKDLGAGLMNRMKSLEERMETLENTLDLLYERILCLPLQPLEKESIETKEE